LKAVATKQGYKAKALDLNIDLRQYAGKEYAKFWDMAEGYGPCEDQEQVLQFYRDFYYFIAVKCKEIAESYSIWITVQNSSSLFTWLFTKQLRKWVGYGGAGIILGGPQIWEFEHTHDWHEIFPEADGAHGKEGEIHWMATDNLDNLPFPDFSDFDIPLYDYAGSLPTYFTRGCLNKCIYCSERHLHGGKFRWRSGERVFEEIEYQTKMHPRVFMFHFHDSISNGNIKELVKFCNKMISTGMNKRVRWGMGNCVIRKEMAEIHGLMAEAGCIHIGYGLETPVEKVQEKIGKKLSVGVDLHRLLGTAHNYGIKLTLNFMFGLPGETEEEFEYMLLFLRKHHWLIHQVNPSLNLCGFFPGSDGWKEPKKYNLLLGDSPLDWKEIDLSLHMTTPRASVYNFYHDRRDKFRRFVETAQQLGIKNLFGVDCGPADPKPKKLYYDKSVTVMPNTELKWHWTWRRMWSSLKTAVKNDTVCRMRGLKYGAGHK
jgi:hypothetical protein